MISSSFLQKALLALENILLAVLEYNHPLLHHVSEGNARALPQ
jgi:hypothetical protein